MIWENGPQSLSYVVGFEWHHLSIRLFHTQDVQCFLEIVWKIFFSKPNRESGACLLVGRKKREFKVLHLLESGFFSKQETELKLPKMIRENLPITIQLENVS